MRTLLALTAMSLLLVAACGDDDDSSDAKTTTTTATTEAIRPNVFAFCDAREELISLVGRAGASDPEALRALASGDEYKSVTDRMLAGAPAEIRADVELLSEPVEAFVESGDYDAFVEEAATQEQLDAQGRIDLFITASCAG